MDEKVQAELIAWMKAGGEFVEAQAPMYVAELLAWEFWSNAILAVVFLLGAALFSVASFLLVRQETREPRDNPIWLVGGFVTGALAVLGLILSPIAACHAVKVKVAPRVVIMDGLAGRIAK